MPVPKKTADKNVCPTHKQRGARFGSVVLFKGLSSLFRVPR